MSVTTAHRQAGARRMRPSRLLRALGVVGASAGTLAVWAIARPLAGAQLDVRLGSGAAVSQVGPAQVVLVSLLVGLAGWGLLAVLERLTSRPRVAWIVLAVTALAISLAGPIAAGVGVATKVALACMHVAAAAVLIPVLARSARS